MARARLLQPTPNPRELKGGELGSASRGASLQQLPPALQKEDPSCFLLPVPLAKGGAGLDAWLLLPLDTFQMTRLRPNSPS